VYVPKNFKAEWGQGDEFHSTTRDKGAVTGVYSMPRGRWPDRPNHPELSDPMWKVMNGCGKSDPTHRNTMAEVAVM
jgi:hypothetical protein